MRRLTTAEIESFGSPSLAFPIDEKNQAMEHGRKAKGRGASAAGAADEGPSRTPSQQRVDDDRAFDLSPAKATGPMREALRELREALLCPLCHSVFQSPMTGPCGHSFCQTCIDAHSCDHFECPVDGCGLPLSMSSRGKSFRLHNPSLETAVTSYESIVQALRKADDHWWDVVDPDTYRLPSEDAKMSFHKEGETDEADYDDEDDDDIEKMIGLTNAPRSGRSSYGVLGLDSASGDEDDD
jgi:RING-type zinc-finger